MGVHHAWGRTLKDVFQRYKAAARLRPALPERLRLPGALGRGRGREVARPELEARHRGVRARRVRRTLQGARRQVRRGDHRAVEAPRDVDGLGQRLPHVLRHEHRVHLAVPQGRPRARAGCTRATARRSGARAAGRRSRSTSRPARRTTRSSSTRRSTSASRSRSARASRWSSGRRRRGRCPRTSPPPSSPTPTTGCATAAGGSREEGGEYDRVVKGEELVGLEYEGPFDDLPAQEGIVHRVIPWDEVALDEGTGIVHIAPGAGARTSSSRACTACPCSRRSTSRGRLLPGYGKFEGLSTDEVEEPVIEALRERGLLVEAGRIVHRYPICWRCKTPLVFRVVDDWFIACDEIRQPLLDANATVEWTPPFYSKRMDDWLRNMGDWNISRKRYFGLPLPFYPCECGHLNVIGSRAELEERATGGPRPAAGAAPALDRRGPDPLRGLRRGCPADPGGRRRLARRRHRPVLDARLAEPRVDRGGYATGAAKGLSGADLPDHAYWERWFPADWISEMRRADPALVLLDLVHVGDADRAVSVPRGADLREACATRRGARCTARGNTIEADEALDRMGADVDALACSASSPRPEHQLRLRAGG